VRYIRAVVTDARPTGICVRAV